MNILKNDVSKRDNESYLDKLARLINPDRERPKEFRPGMSSNEAADIMSDRLIEVIKKQFDEAKQKLEPTE
ncbi:hypothetical protein [Algoriphagus aquimarinus]|uniref:hypothetical protein n=1 Tax=Algoriphagus aquimarinus TaxID=237018 RepID=UPI0030DB17ED|tara:strand:- start:1055 stop:1267 length:213 start_codon:yes stop_codon:yes gene_type:complete